MDSQSEPILIAGTGALACLFAGRLAAAGHPVQILGTWPEGLAALREQGVRVVGVSGEECAYPVSVLAGLPTASTRLALVLVKAWQTHRAAAQLAAGLPPDGLALSLQNGLGNREVLATALGAERAAVGSTTYGATLLAPGLVRPAGDGVVSLGAQPRLEPLALALRRAGFAVEVVPDPEPLLWGKLAINAAINPLTALLEAPNGALLEREAARELMATAAQEAAAVARAQGIHLPYPDPARMAEEVARRTAGNRSSMLQDVQRGAPTEIDAICGAIVRAGRRLGIPTPVNETLWKLVQAKVQGGRD